MSTPVPEGWYPDPTVAIPTAAIPTAAIPSAALRGAEVAKALIPHPTDDPFYSYTGTTPLDDVGPGTALATRSVPFPLLGGPTSLTATQLLYRSTSQTGAPTVNVTWVIQPLGHTDKKNVLSF